MALKGVLTNHLRSILSFALIFMAQFVFCFVAEIYPKLGFPMIFHVTTIVLCLIYVHNLHQSPNDVQYEMVRHCEVNFADSDDKDKLMDN